MGRPSARRDETRLTPSLDTAAAPSQEACAERAPGAPRNELRALAAECRYKVSDLARRLEISPRQLRRAFVAELGCSAHAWLRELRLQDAQRLLRSSLSVKQVAFALGFRQESQFSRDFRAHFGYSPSADLPLARRALAPLLKLESLLEAPPKSARKMRTRIGHRDAPAWRRRPG